MTLDLSVVVPVFNEGENIEPLAGEITAALAYCHYEIVVVDDGSTDDTAAAVRRARENCGPHIRLLRHAQRAGQSAAIYSGIAAARADWIATLDGDGQNDPADIPHLIAARQARGNAEVKLVMGDRIARHDSWLRRAESRLANDMRRGLLGDGSRDSGCGIKLISRDTFLALPRFDHMHRFLPALCQRAGARVISVPVNHRLRTHGESKYGLFDRLWVGLCDLVGVMWLQRRRIEALEVREE